MKKIFLLLVVGLVLLASQVEGALTDGLINVWDFETDPSTSNLEDQVSPGNDSTSDDVQGRVTGINNYGWDFEESSSDDVALPNKLLNDLPQYTINFWVKYETITGGKNSPFWGSDGSWNNGCWIGSSPYLRCRLSTSTQNDEDVGSSSAARMNVGWNMVTITYDGAYMRVMVNGTEKTGEPRTGIAAHSGNTYFGARDGNSLHLDGVLDEFYIWNKNLTASEISDLWNNGNGNFYPTFGGGGGGSNVASPSIVKPRQNEYNSTQTDIEINCTNNNTYLWFGQDADPIQPIWENATNTTWTTNASSDGKYFFKAACWNDGEASSNTSIYNWTLDTAQPIITLQSDTNIQLDNSTIFTPSVHDLIVNVTFTDDNLYQTAVNITYSNGTAIYTAHNTTITGVTDNITAVVDLDSVGIDTFKVIIESSDTHTARKIKRYNVRKDVFNTYLDYETAEGTNIKIEVMENWLNINKFNTRKLKDRYTFDLDLKQKPKKLKFRVTSDKPLHYLESSNYTGHFVSGKNWIDFEEIGIKKNELQIVTIDAYTAEVTINNPKKKKYNFNSIGGLNINEKHYEFKTGSLVTIYAFNSLNAEPITAQSNLSGMTSTGHPISFQNITSGTYNVSLNATSYENKSIEFTVSSGITNVSVNMTPIGVQFYFYDEKTENLIGLNANNSMTIYLEKTGFSKTYTGITANPYTLTNLSSGTYNTKISSGTYPIRRYFEIIITDITGDTVNGYFVNTSEGSNIQFNTVDGDGNAIENVRMSVKRSIDGVSTVVGQGDTDFSGATRITLDTNYEYTINFTHPSYADRIINLEPSADGSPYSITLNDLVSVTPPLVESIRIRKINYNLTYTNATKTVLFKWHDTESYADEYCLQVVDFNTTPYFRQCHNSAAGSHNYVLTDNNNTVTATAYVLKNNRKYTLDSLDISFKDAWVSFGSDGLILGMVVFLTLSLIGLFHPVASIAMGLVAMIGMFAVGILPISIGSIMGLIFVAVVIFTAMVKK